MVTRKKPPPAYPNSKTIGYPMAEVASEHRANESLHEKIMGKCGESLGTYTRTGGFTDNIIEKNGMMFQLTMIEFQRV